MARQREGRTLHIALSKFCRTDSPSAENPSICDGRTVGRAGIAEVSMVVGLINVVEEFRDAEVVLIRRSSLTFGRWRCDCRSTDSCVGVVKSSSSAILRGVQSSSSAVLVVQSVGVSGGLPGVRSPFSEEESCILGV